MNRQMNVAAISGALAGLWYLSSADADEGVMPSHRIEMAFEIVAGRLDGVWLSRANGERRPLHRVTFDGSELRIQMTPDQAVADGGVELILRPTGPDAFEGSWQRADGVTMGHRLKLVRAR